MATEKRRRQRSPCRLEAVVAGEVGGVWTGPCRDISMHGLFLSGADGKASSGRRCRVEILVKGGTSSVALTMRGRIVRVDPQGLAVAFEAMDAETSWHLRHIVVVHAADPERVKRELGG